MKPTLLAMASFWLLTCPQVCDGAEAILGDPTLHATHQTGRISMAWSAVPGTTVLEMTDRWGPETRWWHSRLVAQVNADQHRATAPATGPARFFRVATNDYVGWFETVRGPLSTRDVGVILPHEHLFTDLRGPTTSGYGQADVEDVVRVMKPLMSAARDQKVGLLVECTGIGVGRNVPIIKRLSEESGLPVIIPTGVYGRANFAPTEHRAMSEDELTALFVRELRDGIEGTGVKAGFIKIACSDTGLTALETKFLRAAGRAARDTGAAVASHTVLGSAAKKQADILESISPSIRFIWVHAQAERDRKWHQQLAARGVYIEFDSLGWTPSEDSALIAAIKQLLAAGYADRVLLSHDAGWYQPGQRNGGSQKPFTYLLGTFAPKLRSSGVDEDTLKLLLETNPQRAFAFWARPADAPSEMKTR